MGKPAFAFAHKEDGVSGIFDDVTMVAKIQSKGCTRGKRIGEKDTKGILAAVTQFLAGKSLVLEKNERRAGIKGYGCDLEGACKLEEKELRSTRERAKIDRGISVEGVVGVDGGVDVVAQSGEVHRRGRETGKNMGSPDIVKGGFVDDAGLPDQEVFRAHVIREDVKRAGDYSIDSRMEKMAGSGREFFEEDAEGVRGIKARDIGFPGDNKSGIGRRLEAGALELCEEIASGVIGKADISGDELLVKDGCAEETRHLLLFRRIVRNRKGVTQAGENDSGDAALEGSVESETAFLKREDSIAMADLDAIIGRDGVDVLRIRGECIEGSKNFTGRKIGREASNRPRKEKKKRGGKESHKTSVVIFGMKEQDRGRGARSAA